MTQTTEHPSHYPPTRLQSVASALGFGLSSFKALTWGTGGRLVPGVSRALAVESDLQVPDKADVVVIGGGNIGVMTALNLAERGVSVCLCEKGVIAGEASGRSLGYIDSLFMDPAKAELIIRAKQQWQGMNTRLENDCGYRQSGVAAFIQNEEVLEGARMWAAAMQDVPGVSARVLSPAEALKLAPGRWDNLLGALHEPTDAIAEPRLFAPLAAQAARNKGAVILQDCAVRGVETSAGRASAVVTERGRIACQAVVLAGGAWSPHMARSLGLDVPQFMAFSSVARLAASPGPETGIVSTDGNYVIRRNLDGGYDICRPVAATPVTPSVLRNLPRLQPAYEHMADQLKPVFNLSTFMAEWRIPRRWPLDRPSPFESNRIMVPETHPQMLQQAHDAIARNLPEIGQAAVIEQWAGVLTSTLDNMPIISSVDTLPGLYLGTGFYFGLTMAPAAGEALADLVMGNQPQIDLSLYRHARFSDGSPIIFRP
ncbi:FAD-dependent oxidoreductase [Pseudomonas sp. LRF_L74]|uniref:NAD(P)/FAD-dependent oxidoreductase n=1 Tax=Pseudomonas sp. LRF_L74 TaxID=3369422 RepID=UPI003F646C9E